MCISPLHVVMGVQLCLRPFDRRLLQFGKHYELKPGKLSEALKCHETRDLMPVAASIPPLRQQIPIDQRHLQNGLSDDRQRGRVCLGMGDHRDIRRLFGDGGITEQSLPPEVTGPGSARSCKWHESSETTDRQPAFYQKSLDFRCVLVCCV